jgi:hypothetical protein
MSVKALLMFALMPFGGSFVTLTEFCKTDTGNAFEGIELMYSRNSLCTFADCSAIRCISLSMANIHEVAK